LRFLVIFPPIFPQSTPSQAASTADSPKFDAALVKIHKKGRGGNNFRQAGGHIAIRAFDLQQLMAIAYDLPSLSQAANTIVGMPHWGNVNIFDIEAEAPGTPTLDQKRLMLQSLLADRFKLVVHHDTRQLPIYVVVVANGGRLGPQLHRHDPAVNCEAVSGAQLSGQISSPAPSTERPRTPEDIAMSALQQLPCGRVVGGLLAPNDHYQVWAGGRKVGMDTISAGIGTMEYIDRPVLNKTGLSGDFDFTVEWDSRNADLQASPPRADQSEPLGNSLFEAFRDQLGLKVDSQKGPVDVIIIDHAELPMEN
jgi:uncharacterized protein (TIGR03435 family)